MSEQMGQYLDEDFDGAEAASETAAEEQEFEQQGETVKEGFDPVPMAIPTYQQERGGVAWCELYGKKKDDAGNLHLVKINLTNRGENAEGALRGLLQALEIARTEFKMLPYMPTLPANPPAVAIQNAPQAIAAPGPSTMTPPPPPGVPGGNPAPTAAQAATGGTYQIVKVEVAPRADGKTEIKLYSQGHKFPDLKMYGTPEKIAAQFGPGWQKEHFMAVTAYNVALKVDWVQSTNKTASGTYYKNVSAINPG